MRCDLENFYSTGKMSMKKASLSFSCFRITSLFLNYHSHPTLTFHTKKVKGGGSDGSTSFDTYNIHNTG